MSTTNKDAINKSNLEKEAIIISKKLGKYVISLIDHWVNYKERFILNGTYFIALIG